MPYSSTKTIVLKYLDFYCYKAEWFYHLPTAFLAANTANSAYNKTAIIKLNVVVYISSGYVVYLALCTSHSKQRM